MEFTDIEQLNMGLVAQSSEYILALFCYRLVWNLKCMVNLQIFTQNSISCIKCISIGISHNIRLLFLFYKGNYVVEGLTYLVERQHIP